MSDEPTQEPSGSTTGEPTTNPSVDQTPEATEQEPAPVDEEKTDVALSLSDFFAPSSEWTENRYNIADEKNISGISNSLRSFDENNAAVLELRLENSFEVLKMRVGQANTSESSEHVLVVQTIGNGSQIDVQRVPFNAIQEISVPVSGVNALQLRFYLDNELGNTSGSVTAVISGVMLE